MILEKEYSYYYWLTVDLTDTEFENFISNVNKVNLIDGVDIEDKQVCIKFNQVKPSKPQEIKWAKAKNEQNAKKFLRVLSKHIDGRLYFNVNHHIIKHK